MDSTSSLGEGRIAPLLARYALPSIVGMVVSALYNIVDRVFIGRGVGALAIAGVTVAFSFQLVMIAFSVLIGVGAGARISICLGRGDRDRAERYLGNGLALNLGISTAMAILGLIFVDPLLKIFGASPEVLPYARSFVRVIFMGCPVAVISTGFNGFIRAEGNPRTAMVTQLIGPALNVILCPTFIFALRLGVVGSALANVISQAAGAAWVLSYYLSGRSLLKIKAANLVPRLDIALSIVTLGAAPALSEFASSIMGGIMNNQLERYGGDMAVTAMGIVFAIASLVYLTMLGINMGMQPIIGYNIGARLYGRVRKVELAAIGVSSLFALLCYAVVQLFPSACVALFAGPGSGAGSIGVYALHRYFLLLPLMGLQVIGSGYFQASGRPLKSLLLGLSRQFLILVPMIIVLPLFWGLDGLWSAQPVADGSAFLLTAIFLGRELRRLGRAADSSATAA